MPRRRTPLPPPNGEGEPPEVDIAELQTALLAHPASKVRLLEDMAAAHDAEVKRLCAWRTQVREWLRVATPNIQPALRRLHWLRNEPRLSRA